MKENFYKIIFKLFLCALLNGTFYVNAGSSEESTNTKIAEEQNKQTANEDEEKNSVQPIVAASAGKEADVNLLLEALLKKEREIEAEKKKNELLKQENEALKKEIEQLNQSAGLSQEFINKEKARFLYDIGCVYRSAGLYKEAEHAFLEALKLVPDDAYTHYNLAVLYEDDFNNKTAAKAHYLKFLELAPEDSDAARVKEWIEHLK